MWKATFRWWATFFMIVILCAYNWLARKYHYLEYKEHRVSVLIYGSVIIVFSSVCLYFDVDLLIYIDNNKIGEETGKDIIYNVVFEMIVDQAKWVL